MNSKFASINPMQKQMTTIQIICVGWLCTSPFTFLAASNDLKKAIKTSTAWDYDAQNYEYYALVWFEQRKCSCDLVRSPKLVIKFLQTVYYQFWGYLPFCTLMNVPILKGVSFRLMVLFVRPEKTEKFNPKNFGDVTILCSPLLVPFGIHPVSL